KGTRMTLIEDEVVGGVTLVSLADLTVDPHYQVRANGLNEGHAQSLSKLLLGEEGTEDEYQLDPIDVVRIPAPTGAILTVAHGHHRHRAYVIAGRTAIPARIKDGSADDALETSIRGNIRNGLPWPEAERIMALHKLLATEKYDQWPFSKLAKLCGLGPRTVRNEWMALNPGNVERTYTAGDGKVITQKIGAGSRVPVAPPQALDFDDGYETATTPHAPQPSTNAAPTGSYSTPQATSQSYSAPSPSHAPQAPPSAPAGFVQIKRPSFVHPTQTLTEITLTWALADESEGQWTLGSVKQLPRAVKVALIDLLMEE
ncbi:MAG: ParB N-terminal domain-containing protein, partial [Chloroflexales bacterium]